MQCSYHMEGQGSSQCTLVHSLHEHPPNDMNETIHSYNNFVKKLFCNKLNTNIHIRREREREREVKEKAMAGQTHQTKLRSDIKIHLSTFNNKIIYLILNKQIKDHFMKSGIKQYN